LKVTGDFHDVLPLQGGNGNTCLVLGDVCGKGIASALYMARVLGYFRAAAGSRRSADGLLSAVNSLVSGESTTLAFVTACLVSVDKERQKMSFYNAGHLPPYLFNDKSRTLRVVKLPGFPLGVDPAGKYDGTSLELSSGDCLVLYTDGIIEAANPSGEFFGRSRLEATIASHRGSAEELVRTIRTAVHHFAAGEPQSDDQTLLVARKT